MNGSDSTSTDLMISALEHLREAIELLDQAEAPGQIAAHADLARHQLIEAIAASGATAAEMASFPNVGTLSTS
jgi:hypothetical protein